MSAERILSAAGVAFDARRRSHSAALTCTDGNAGGRVADGSPTCLDVCAQLDQWGPSVVLYNGPFDPQFNVSAPTKGLYQDFSLLLPEGWLTGQSGLQVAHFFSVGVRALWLAIRLVRG